MINKSSRYTSRQNLAMFPKAKDYFKAYLASAVDPDNIRGNKLKRVDHFPEKEELFAADVPIDRKIFSTDRFRRYWLVTGPQELKDNGCDDIFTQSVEVAYSLGLRLGLGIAETRRVMFEGQPTYASRFLPNAIDCGFLEDKRIPEETRKKVIRSVNLFFPFNFLIATGGDNQFVFTPKGNVLIVDYWCSVACSRYVPIKANKGFRQDDEFWLDVDAQRACIRYYKMYPIDIPTDAGLVKVAVDRVCLLSDEDLRASSKFAPGKLALKTFEYLKWRRDNIKEVFAELLK